MKKVDETINAICNWIQQELKMLDNAQEESIVPEMTEALAELVSARGRTPNYLMANINAAAQRAAKALDGIDFKLDTEALEAVTAKSNALSSETY